jgi:hypothetical protein
MRMEGEMIEKSLDTRLAMVFGAEYMNLSRRDRALIVRDCEEEDGVADLAEYRRNIGAGNLFAYVKCQRVRFAYA